MAGDVTALASQIANATQVLHDPLSSPDARRTANEFVLGASEHPLVLGAAVQLVGANSPPATRFFAFRLLGVVAAAGRLPVQDTQTAQLRAMLLDMVRQSTLAAGGDLSTVPAFVREKFTQALAAVAIYGSAWPEGWPELQPELLDAGRRSHAHAALSLNFFRNMAETLQSDAASRLPPLRRKGLQMQLTEASATIFSALGHFVTSLFPNHPELDRAAVLLIQELSPIVPLSKFLASDVDTFLLLKLQDRRLRSEVLHALSEWLSKDVAKDLKEAPERMSKFLKSVCNLANDCRVDGSDLSPEDYEAHKSVAMLIRDFVDCNKPSFDRLPELQELGYRSALQLLMYPSVLIQAEALSIVHQIMKASLPDVRPAQKAAKGVAPPSHRTPPAWLELKAKFLPLLFLCTHRDIPASFDLFPLPGGFRRAMEITSELDAEEDLPLVRQVIKGRVVEIVGAMSPVPAAIMESLGFVHELLPRVLGGAAFASFDAALGLAERIMPSVKVSAGAEAVQACKTLLTLIMQSIVPGPEYEIRRLDCLNRIGGALDLLAEAGVDQENAIIVQVFTHLFSVIGAGNLELRTKALYASIGICKTAPKAIRPVLVPIVNQAAELLKGAQDNQHVLCEALVAASTAAQNFEQQQQLVQNLLEPLVVRWTSVVTALADAEKLAANLAGDRAGLEAAHQLVLCFWACFRSSSVPSDPAVAASGGFLKQQVAGPDGLGEASLHTRNPAGAVVAAMLPGLITLIRAFHLAFPSDVTRPAEVGSSILRPYLRALDKEELKALTSSLDSKGKEEAASWEHEFPAPPGEDPARVFGGRHLLYSLRAHLYKCLGAALNVVQDGALTNPQLPELLGAALIDSMDLAHPYHLELQLRHVWHTVFGPTGMPAATETLRRALSAALLPRLLPAVATALERYWQWLRLPEGHPVAAVAADGGKGEAGTLLWAMCTGTVMASRTFVELAASLAAHGGPLLVVGASFTPAATVGEVVQADVSGGDVAAMATPSGSRRKNKHKGGGNDMATGAPGGGVDASGAKQSLGFAGAVLASPAVLQAVQGALFIAARWQDAKTISHALIGMRVIAVRLMSGGEVHQSLREIHAAAPEAPQRCVPALELVLTPLVGLCASPPAPLPGDGALQTMIGKPFADFFLPERQQGRVDPSPFAAGVVAALWPIIWGLCQIFVHVCKRAKAEPAIQHVAHFPVLAEACRLLVSLKRVAEQDVHMVVSRMVDQKVDPKAKRAALRIIVRTAVDPEPGPGETWS